LFLTDAILFSGNAYSGSGDALNARNIGYGVKNGIVGNFFVSGLIKQWRPITNSAKLLGINFEDKGSNAGIESVAENGLAYDQCQGGLLDATNAVNYCTSKGFSLPTTLQTLGWNISGIPSCPEVSGNGWTRTNSSTPDSNYYVWWGTSTYGYAYSYSPLGVRCVK